MIALLADIHGNREAMTACLADAERRNAERYVFLGDLVGYGADPGWVTDRAMEYVARGAIAILGNHDAAAAGKPMAMNQTAMEAITWTRGMLDAAQRNFLENLPMAVEEADRLYVHASADEPSRWHYIVDAGRARKSFEATPARQTFCGHVHSPALYLLSQAGKLFGFGPPPASLFRCWEPALPCRARRRRATARPQSGGLLRLARRDAEHAHLHPRALRRRVRGAENPRCRPAGRARRAPGAGLLTWPVSLRPATSSAAFAWSRNSTTAAMARCGKCRAQTLPRRW